MEGTRQFYPPETDCGRNASNCAGICTDGRQPRRLSRSQVRWRTRNQIHLARATTSRRYQGDIQILRPPTPSTPRPRRLYLRGRLSLTEGGGTQHKEDTANPPRTERRGWWGTPKLFGYPPPPSPPF